MKIGILKSLGHNMADSMASGIGLLIGYYQMDVFAEAAAAPQGHLTVNLLTGTATDAVPSQSLARALALYRDALPAMCVKHGISLGEIKALEARFGTDAAYGRHFKVKVESALGKTSTDQYIGIPGRRLRRGKRFPNS